jgi:ATP phosphoribosyltransferase
MMTGGDDPGTSRPLRLAVPKGRFARQSASVVHSLGSVLPGGAAGCFLLRASDIPGCVADGHVDVGIAPDEWCLELKHSRTNPGVLVRPPGFGWITTRLSFFGAGPGAWPSGGPVAVATSFPSLVRHLLRTRGLHPEIVHLKGAVEVAVPNIAPVGFDCVETGATLRSQGLVELCTPFAGLGMSLVCSRRWLDRTGTEVAEGVLEAIVRAARLAEHAPEAHDDESRGY